MMPALAEALKWPAIVVGVVVFLLLVLTGLRKLISSGAVAKDDLKEQQAASDAEARATEVERLAPKTPAALAADLLRKLRAGRNKS